MDSKEVDPTPAAIEAIAIRVAELLTRRQQPPDQLVDAAELARRLGVSRSWVYENATRLGGVRLSGRTRGRLRFDPAAAVAAAEGANPSAVEPSRQRHSRRSAEIPLLPVHDSGNRPNVRRPVGREDIGPGIYGTPFEKGRWPLPERKR